MTTNDWKTQLQRAADEVRQTSDAAFDLWMWLPSYLSAEEAHGGEAMVNDLRPSTPEIVKEAAMVLTCIRVDRQLDPLFACPCGCGHRTDLGDYFGRGRVVEIQKPSLDEETIAKIREMIDDWTGRVATLVSQSTSIEDDWRLADLPDVGDTWWWHVDDKPKYRVVVRYLRWDGEEWTVHASVPPKVGSVVSGEGVVRGYRVSEWWRRVTDKGDDERQTGESGDD